MELIAARVTNFKSIIDSGWVDIASTTCFVGKSESGKTAFLEALEKINPKDTSRREFDWLKNYPRKALSSYRAKHDAEPSIVVRARFKLSPEEIAEIESMFGQGALKGDQPTIELHKDYKSQLRFVLSVDEEVIVNHFVNSASFSDEIVCATLKRAQSVKELGEIAASLSTKSPEITAFIEKYKDCFNATGARLIYDRLSRHFPKFFYSSDYGVIPGNVSIAQIRKLFAGSVPISSASDKSLLALLELGGISLVDLSDAAQYEDLALKLEAAANIVNDRILSCLKENVRCELTFELVGANSEGSPAINETTSLCIRLRDTKDKVSFSLHERSPSFVRYLSFLTYFSKISQDIAPNQIILLDDPGHGLHAAEQRDLVQVIEHRLACHNQVLYSTNSQFMIDASAPNLPKIVERDDDRGTVVLHDISTTQDRETAFMLQSVLSSDIASNLFIGPNCLFVECPADVVYIRVLNEACRRNGKSTLDPRWAIIPVGSVERIAQFLSLFGEQDLNVAVLLDLSSDEEKRLKSIAGKRSLKFAAVRFSEAMAPAAVQQSPSIPPKRCIGIEDLFGKSFYLELINRAYATKISSLSTKDLPDGDRLAQAVEQCIKSKTLGEHFDRIKPALYLSEHQAELLPQISSKTTEQSSLIFQKLNRLLAAQTAGRRLQLALVR